MDYVYETRLTVTQGFDGSMSASAGLATRLDLQPGFLTSIQVYGDE